MTKKECIKIVNERNAYYKNLEEEKNRYTESITEDAFKKYETILKIQESTFDNANEFSKYTSSVKKFLLTESLEYLFALVVNGGKFLNESSKLYAKQIIENYIEETGVNNIINTINSKNTIFLNYLGSSINESYNMILEKADRNNPNTFSISDDDVETFYDSLDSESFEKASDLIRMRVSTAVEEFISTNKEDKSTIEELLQGTKERIDAIDITKNDQDKIEESYTNDCKRNISNVRSNRTHTIFEELVFKNTNQIIGSKSLLESFTHEGELNMQSIIEHTEMAYNFLELLNTIKLEDCSIESMKNIIKI